MARDGAKRETGKQAPGGPGADPPASRPGGGVVRPPNLLDILVTIHGNGVILRSIVRQEGDEVTAARLKEANGLLQDDIDALESSSIDAWLMKTQGVLADLQSMSDELGQRIDDIRRDIDYANDVVAALGYIDKAIETTAKIFKLLGW